MKKFPPFDKLSKKEQKRLNSAKRRDWNGLSPVTRVAETDKKKYKRHPKHRRNNTDGVYFFCKCFNFLTFAVKSSAL